WNKKRRVSLECTRQAASAAYMRKVASPDPVSCVRATLAEGRDDQFSGPSERLQDAFRRILRTRTRYSGTRSYHYSRRRRRLPRSLMRSAAPRCCRLQNPDFYWFREWALPEKHL